VGRRRRRLTRRARGALESRAGETRPPRATGQPQPCDKASTATLQRHTCQPCTEAALQWRVGCDARASLVLCALGALPVAYSAEALHRLRGQADRASCFFAFSAGSLSNRTKGTPPGWGQGARWPPAPPTTVPRGPA
jgi:hypothetical protein